jgi:general stress protein 26
MPTPDELEARFWRALKADMTMMLGLVGVAEGHTRPMTALLDGDRGPIWFFTSSENDIAEKAGKRARAIATFTSKGHDLFAALHGRVSVDNDRAVIDRLWNRFIAAWFEGGKDDPKLRLLRFDPDDAEIWLDASSAFAGLRLLLGADPKEKYKENVAKVQLR